MSRRYDNRCAEQEVNEWVRRNGYTDVAEWALDSDYKRIAGEWFDAYGTPIDIIEAAYDAKQSADSYEAA